MTSRNRRPLKSVHGYGSIHAMKGTPIATFTNIPDNPDLEVSRVDKQDGKDFDGVPNRADGPTENAGQGHPRSPFDEPSPARPPWRAGPRSCFWPSGFSPPQRCARSGRRPFSSPYCSLLRSPVVLLMNGTGSMPRSIDPNRAARANVRRHRTGSSRGPRARGSN